MNWRDRPFFGLDTETTGVDVETDRIVTACIGLTGGPNRWTARNWLLKQSEPIPDEATEIHGVSTEHANQHGQNPAEALQQIVDDLYRGWSQDMPLVGFNIVYDLTILDRNLRRHRLDPLEINGSVIDPFVIDKALDPYRKGSRKLIDVARHHGITLTETEAHGAEADALTACRIAWKQAAQSAPAAWQDNRNTPLADWPLQALHRWQKACYAEQRESFAAYLAKQGKQLDDPNTIWPLKPWPLFEPHPVMEQADLLDPNLEPAPF